MSKFGMGRRTTQKVRQKVGGQEGRGKEKNDGEIEAKGGWEGGDVEEADIQ